VPTLSALFAEFNAPLPFSTRLVIAISSFLAKNTVLSSAGFVLIVAGFWWFFRKTAMGQRLVTIVLLRLPVFGNLVRNTNSAITMRTISSLISSGVNMVEALLITEQVLANLYYKDVIRIGLKRVEKGEPLANVFKDKVVLYPVLVAELTEVGEETGNLSEMLMNGAVFFEEEVEQITKNLSAAVEPILMILVGLVVGFFAVAMIGPMYSVTSSIDL
jgi:type IV pilus assembly protein PilC